MTPAPDPDAELIALRAKVAPLRRVNRELLGTQTERRAGGVLPGGKASPAAFCIATSSNLAEPAVKLPVVVAVHVAIEIESEVPEVTGVSGNSA